MVDAPEDTGMGQYVNPPQQGGWTQLFNGLANDPVKQSAAVSAGIQLMTGGWGNGIQQLAAGIGAGAAGAAGTAASMQQQAINNRDFQSKQDEGAANRASHEKIAQSNQASRQEIANIQGQSREAVANIRGEYSMYRIASMAGAKNDHEHEIYKTAYNRAMEDITLMGNQSQREQNALAAGQRALDAYRAAKGNGAPGSSVITPGTAAPASGAPGTNTQGAVAKPAASKPTWEAISANPKVQELLKSAQGRATLIRERPDLEQQIMNSATPYEN